MVKAATGQSKQSSVFLSKYLFINKAIILWGVVFLWSYHIKYTLSKIEQMKVIVPVIINL